MLLGLKIRKKKINIEVKKCGLFGMFRGLMFRRREKAPALLLFDFKKPVRREIHSCFVFFPFLALWLDDKNKIVDWKIVKPRKFCVLPKRNFNKLIEIPINKKYKRFIELLCLRQRSV